MSTAMTYKTRAKTPAGVLRAAARYIRKCGWQQGEEGGFGAPACLAGALFTVSPGLPDEPLMLEAFALLQRRVAKGSSGEYVTDFNDMPGRKVEEVLAVLEAR